MAQRTQTDILSVHAETFAVAAKLVSLLMTRGGASKS